MSEWDKSFSNIPKVKQSFMPLLFALFLKTLCPEKKKKKPNWFCTVSCCVGFFLLLSVKKGKSIEKRKEEWQRQLCWLIHFPPHSLLCLNGIFLLGLWVGDWLKTFVSDCKWEVSLVLNSQEVGIFSKGISSNFLQLGMSARDEIQRCLEGRKDQGGNSFLDDGERHAKSWKDWHLSSPLFQPGTDIFFSSVQEHPLSLPNSEE